MRGWELMALATASFPPTKNFKNYLWSFLHQATSSTDEADSRVLSST